ncbi:MAG: protein kinase, partial [Trueperaceae bacterium]|nr:protein kinase [Trueperaceae bacterium]
MLLVFLAIALILAFVLAKLPNWVSYIILVSFLTFSVWLSAFGSVDRSALPLLLVAMSLGLLIPATQNGKQNEKIAPSRNRKAKPKPTMKVKGEASPSLNSMDVPGYDVLEKVGSGGMASVYRAKRQSDGQIVALKIPMEQYVADAKFIRRFHREAEVAQRLDHENIVRTYEHGSVGIKHYMAMEYVDGRSLEGYIESGELNIPLGIEVMKAVVKALQHIHSVGIIHRDIKPANIMIINGGLTSKDPPVLRSDAVKLMDFGIAGGKVLSRLTMTGARVGTPVYMSPEQARGLKIDHRSDVYSLGLVFYEMLTGQTAFKGGYEAIVHQQIFQTPPPPRQLNLAIPKQLDNLIMQMIAKDPNERPKLSDVLGALEESFTEEATSSDLSSRIVITVSSRQGVLRILDTEGSLHSSMGNIGLGEDAFSAAPLSVAVDSQGNYFA